MFYLECYDQYGDPITRMTQWDLNQKIYIKEHNFTNAPLFHYCNKNTEKALVVQSTLSDDNTLVVDVPNQLLIEPYPITAYVYLSENETGKTVEVVNIPITSRPKPNDFEYKDNVEIVKLTDLANEIKALNAQITAEEEIRISQENARVEAENNRANTETQRGQSEAQRATNENTRIQNENARISAENARNVAETERDSAEAIRLASEIERNEAETVRESNEATRISNENIRINSENERNTAETERRNTESIRVSSENERISKENERIEAETERLANEVTRQENETTRIASETERGEAEALRQSNEETRETNETNRITAETSRDEAETIRNSNENTRKSNETTRVNNEATRDSNEEERKSAETTRTTNENTRITNENARIQAENTRETNETTRQTQEEARQTNTTTAISNAEAATTRANNAAKACEDIVVGTGFISSTEKGVANGIATLDADGKVPLTQLPEMNAKDADTLDGHNSDYFATAQSVTDIVNGTTTVGNSASLGGKGASEYFHDLGYLSSDITILDRVKNAINGGVTNGYFLETGSSDSSTGNGGLIIFYKADGSSGIYIEEYDRTTGTVYCAKGVSLSSTSIEWEKTTTDSKLTSALANYLPLSGGTVNSSGNTPIAVNAQGDTSVFIAYKEHNNTLGHIGFTANGQPCAIVSSSKETILHTGNSAKYAQTPYANASYHNSIYRGKDLNGVYTIDQICSMISAGTFDDLYIGDYFDITISTSYTNSEVVRCVFAGFDTKYMNGDESLSRHHAVIVPKNCFTARTQMNATDTTEGAYYNSVMHQTVLPTYATALEAVFGSHLLTYRSLLSNATNNDIASMAGAGWMGVSTGWAWYDTKLRLLSEVEVYGSKIFSSSFYDVGEANLQLPLFSLNPRSKIAGSGGTGDGRMWYWLSSVASSVYFANVYYYGSAYYRGASNAAGVRPAFIIG